MHNHNFCFYVITLKKHHRFIPGSSASDVHYQGFLLEGLEGLSGWNQARALAAAQQQDSQLRAFYLKLACKVGTHCDNITHEYII